MNLAILSTADFPATVEQLVAKNPRIMPDVVEAGLRRMELVGQVRRVGKMYYTLRDPEDCSLFPPRIPVAKPGKKLVHGPGGPCPVCKKLTKRPGAKFCSLVCRANSMRLARSKCAVCGTRVKGVINKYCGRKCYRISCQGKRERI